MGTEADDFDGMLSRARSGDETAFLRLWDHLHPRLLRYLRVLGCDEADDVASETWLQAVRDLGRFDGGADDFRCWLFTIGRHRAIDASRARIRFRSRLMTAAVVPVPEPSPVEDEVLDGLSTRQAVAVVAGLSPDLFEQAGHGPGWREAGSAVTDRDGDVTLTVPHLTSNASFRLAAPGGALSPPVAITVIPPVHLGLAAGGRAGVDLLTARAPFAQAGDVVVLQERSGGTWYRVGERVLGQDHRAFFTVLVPLSGPAEYRVVLPGTAVHGRSVSGWVRVAARLAQVRAARRAPP